MPTSERAATDVPAVRRVGVRPVLVLGLGNILMRDEGVGVRVVQALERGALPPEVELCDGGTAGVDLLDILAERRRVLVIDALDADRPPGSVWRLTPEELEPGAAVALSVHDLGFLEALGMARQLGVAPREVVILGVVPWDVGCGLELSPGMRRLLPGLCQLVLQELGLPRGDSAGLDFLEEGRS